MVEIEGSTSGQSAMRRGGIFRKELFIALVLSLLVLVSYWEVKRNGFINYDDPLYVTDNRHVQRGLSIRELVWALTASDVSNWHPLTWVSLMADRELFGMNAGGYHWTSVILHLVSGLVLFFVLRRMTGRLWGSGFVAGLFLVHPLHVESVAWVAERKDVLSGLFWMLGLWGYARYAERPDVVRYGWVVFFFVLGLLSKPMVVTFPFVLLLLDWWPLGRMAGGKGVLVRLVYEKVPFFILSAMGSIITFIVQREGNALMSLQNLPFADRMANAVVSYAQYLVKMVWPFSLAVFYPHPGIWPVREVLLSLLLLIFITVFVLMQVGRRPYLLVGWLWYVGTLVPVIGLVQIGGQAMADRYTYLPLIGIFIMAVWAAEDILGGFSALRVIGGSVAGVVMVVLVAATQTQVGYWKDSITLFTHTLSVTGRNHLAHHELALAMAVEGNIEASMSHYREALRIKPSFVEAHNGAGHLLMVQGRDAEAIAQFEEAIHIRPDFAPALKNLGDVHLRRGMVDRAIPLYERALSFDNQEPELFNNYGVALFSIGQGDRAVTQIRKAVALDPDYREAQENLRKILKPRADQ